MKRPGIYVFLALALLAALLVLAPRLSGAQMACDACHDVHNAAGGTLNIAAEFDLICDTCQR